MNADDPTPQDLAARVRALPREVQPPHDLWPGIRRRLPPRRRRMPAWLPLAAALALVLVGSWLTRAGPAAPAPSSVAGDTPAGATSAELLLAAIEREPGVLAPETVAALRRNVALVDSAIAETERALALDPGNADLEALVRLVRRQRLDLLRQATRLPRT